MCKLDAEKLKAIDKPFHQLLQESQQLSKRNYFGIYSVLRHSVIQVIPYYNVLIHYIRHNVHITFATRTE